MRVRHGGRGYTSLPWAHLQVLGQGHFLGFWSVLLDSSSGSLSSGAWEAPCSRHTRGPWEHTPVRGTLFYRKQTWNVNWTSQEAVICCFTVLGAIYRHLLPHRQQQKNSPPMPREKQHLGAPGPSSWLLLVVGLFQSFHRCQGGPALCSSSSEEYLILDLLSQ